ncbi:bifunctional aspartate transaminase/aspartate 4-decarboxylase [Ottowia sp.]|uniref:bifunctional aspartate transaminase/aspartate 4-decarboxylase n=1 Tax=Ottowia sp. TaxID=1898956 RepID=UPI003A8C8843
MKLVDYQKLDKLSPFEIKDQLIQLAKAETGHGSRAFLNAGRGNPNWIATRAREAFFLLGQFALTEAKRVFHDPVGLAGMPAKRGAHGRLMQWLDGQQAAHMPGADTLRAVVAHAINTLGFKPDEFVHELTDSVIGDNYPVPDRALVHNEQIVRKYLDWAMLGGQPPEGKFDLFPVEGGTAAMCYLFKALKNNRLLNAGDTIALATPIFTPYLEMPELEDYALKTVFMNAEQEDELQYTENDFKLLEDPKVKALFLVNPGNPSAVALKPETLGRLEKLVKEKRPDLIILTDDVYGTFVKGFQSVMSVLPHNTLGVYSFSKYFGCTGWRLGVIALHEDNILDKKIAAAAEDVQVKLDYRYGPLTLEPRHIKFIDRVVADSRDVALNHTSGLSLPQQVMMSLFALVELMDTQRTYQDACIAIVQNRFRLLVDGMGIEVEPNQYFDAYYGIIDFEFWLKKYVGEDVVNWVKKNIHPLDIAFKLAEGHGIVLLNGSGFHAPGWSARVSFANLNDDAYEAIGRAVRAIAVGYVQAYEASRKK